MSFPVLISSANYTSGNQFKISFPNIVDLTNYDASVENFYIPYSWYNISQALNNNVFQLVIPGFSSNVTVSIVIPDGAYNITTLNNFLDYWFLSNNYYIQNTTTLAYTYYGSFQLSPSSYQVQWITSALPSSSNGTDALASPSLTGYTVGSAFHNNWPSATNQSIQLIISSNNTFGSIIGFNAATYPPAATITGTTYTIGSQITPNVNPIYAVQCRLSCLYNQFSSNSQLLHIFSNLGQSIGSLIDASPKFYQAVPCAGSHKDLYLTLYDELGNPLNFLDPSVLIKLSFKKK